MRWSLCFAILVGMSQSVTIVGAGLAGSEAALQLADRGVRVRLVEMRPKTPTPVHVTGCCAELVCSNSLKSEKPDSAAGMLKRELAELGSQLYAQAKLHAVPAGGALAVDRTAFAEAVTALVEAHPLIDLVHEEVVDLVQAAEGADALVVAAGPLASDALAASLSRLAGEEHLAFYDAAAPIVMADSLDYAKLFRQSRYEDAAADAGDYLSSVDMIRAKARWALANDAGKPILSTDDRLELRTARHPLLQQTLRAQGREVVPLDLALDRRKHILVISGPNAGGKSVCLKTTGLMQYLFQCGYPVPASEVSELPVFRSIFIDIGDEQSIDDDLSTYSSHLRNMKNMLAGASDRTLVLIDEFGSGTEPTIGGAIAEAILERLLERGCYGVVTTHYANIKYFASNAEGVANGAMLFDVQRIRPLFKLEIGKPGSSFAVEIARKIGLPEEIIRAASDKAGSDHINLERQLREIARDKRYWEQKRDRIRLTDRKIEELEQSYAAQLARIRQERSEILRAAKAEARELMAEANRRIEQTIKEIREAQAEREMTRFIRRDLDAFKERVEQADAVDAEKAARIEREMDKLWRRRERREERRRQPVAAGDAQPVVAPPREIEVGSKVVLEGQQTPGVVQSLKGDKVQVAFGQLLTTVDRKRLRVVSNSEYREATRPVTARTVVSVDVAARKLNFKDHIDVRGMRASEAVEAVQNFIDDALMVGVGSVTILHGKGTGALKEEIRRYLRTVPDIAGVADEHADRGGAGITVVTFGSE